MNTIDIFSIHNYIIKQYSTTNEFNFYYYLLNTIPIIDTYIDLKKKCKKIYFIKNTNNSNNHNTKEDIDVLVKKYQKILNDYFPNEYNNMLEWNKHSQDDEIIYNNEQEINEIKNNLKSCSCIMSQDNQYLIHDNNFVCEICGVVNNQLKSTVSYKDIDRINLSTKYTYDRKTHFRDCISQFQGKQNSYIPKEVYEHIYTEMIQLGLIPNNYSELPKSIVFENITKEQILLFMKQLGYSKYYEDIVLIYHEITGKNTPDITHLENDLLKDFDLLTELYDKQIKKEKKTSRKNFINTQYVLYQLLRRHKYPCKKEDFNILKTIDLKYHHDTICQELFQILGWNFSALF